ncbi:MAG: hypothetical protein ABSH50_09410 [Bryobacteraceae bacterium]|jgi:uncharacterized protein (TIGR03437 family)
MNLAAKVVCALVLSFGLLADVADAQLTINSITNAASFIYSPLPNSSIAQGAFFVILGNGSATSTGTSAWGTYPLPTALDGTSVTVSVGDVTKPALIYYVGPSWGSANTQIDAVMPSGMPTGTGTVVVTQSGVGSDPAPVTVVASSPGGYALNGAGSGAGLFYNIATDGSTTQNTLFQTAKPGQIVELHGTGLGPAVEPGQEGKQAPYQVDLRTTSFLVNVWIGGQPATVEYAGRSSYTAEDLIAFTVPEGVSGCYNEVAVYAGAPGAQVVSNFTSLAVDPAGAPCQDADGINMNELAGAIDSKGSVNVGAIGLLSNYTTLYIFGSPFQWDNDTVNGEIVNLNTQQLDASFGLTDIPTVNNCAVYTYMAYPPPVDPVLGGALGPVTWLDAGTSLSIEGTNGTQPVPKLADGDGYNGLVGGSTLAQLLAGTGLAPFYLSAQGWGTSSWSYDILAGGFTVTGPGGGNVGAFSASLDVSAAASSFQWTNQIITAAPISRATPLTITWTGGDPNGFVDILAISSTLQSGLTPTETTPGAYVECIAPSSAGEFTIPVYVLQSLPSTAGSTAAIPPGSLQVGPASGAVEVTPVPSGLDAAYIFYQYVAGVNVTWE